MNYLTLNKLIEQVDLKTHGDKPLHVFADGKNYPVLEPQIFSKTIELGCGWASLEEVDMKYLGVIDE